MPLEALTTTNLVSIGTTVGAAIAAYVITRLGIRRWRVEQVEKRQIELAEKALSLIYESEDVFNAIRNAWAASWEYASRTVPENEGEAEKSKRNTHFVTLARIERFKPYFDRLYDIYPTYSATFGKTASKPLRDILIIRTEIAHAAQALMDHDSYREDETDKKFYHSMKEKVWDMGQKNKDGTPSISERLAAITQQVEQQAMPLLKTQYRTDK